MNEQTTTAEHPVFGDVIASYSRADAIRDGELVDVTPWAKEAWFTYSVAVTRAVWVGLIEPSAVAKAGGESERGRAHDVLWMAYRAIRWTRGPKDRVRFKVLATDERNRKRLHTLIVVCGPGDTPEPVLTIMYPEED